MELYALSSGLDPDDGITRKSYFRNTERGDSTNQFLLCELTAKLRKIIISGLIIRSVKLKNLPRGLVCVLAGKHAGKVGIFSAALMVMTPCMCESPSCDLMYTSLKIS